MDLTRSLSGLFEKLLVVREQPDKKDIYSNEFVGFRSLRRLLWSKVSSKPDIYGLCFTKFVGFCFRVQLSWQISIWQACQPPSLWPRQIPVCRSPHRYKTVQAKQQYTHFTQKKNCHTRLCSDATVSILSFYLLFLLPEPLEMDLCCSSYSCSSLRCLALERPSSHTTKISAAATRMMTECLVSSRKPNILPKTATPIMNAQNVINFIKMPFSIFSLLT